MTTEIQAPDQAHEREVERQAAALEAELMALPQELRQKLQGDIQMAKQSGDLSALSRTKMEIDDSQVRQMQQAVLGGAVAGGILAELSHLQPLAELAKPHGEKLLDSGVPPELTAMSEGNHFTPMVNPGVQVTIMPAIDKGQGAGLTARK